MIRLSFGALLAFGACLVLVGANQQEIAAQLGLDLAETGLLGAVLALGIGIGVAGAGPLVDRWSRRPIFAVASLGAGVSLLAFSGELTLIRAALQVGLAGCFIGAQETVVNASIGERFGARASKPLLIVHSAATLGAVLTPFGIGWLATRTDWTTSFQLAGAFELALAAAVWAVRLPPPPHRDRESTLLAPLFEVMQPAIVPFALVGFAYVGVESTLSIFAVPYVDEVLGLDGTRGRSSISAFWGGLLLGRLLVLAWQREADARLLVGAGIGGGLVIAIGVGWAVSPPELVFAACGISFGFVFPVMIALTGQRFSAAQGSATGLVAGCAALGGFVIPWLHGALGDALGVRPSFLLLVGWCLVIVVAARSAWQRRTT
ncbi:MAG: MFS transporter [Deltaproteobacteria bacterium]|nr:MAG: MFS transporter [Deltaproteobacteria bacterium]